MSSKASYDPVGKANPECGDDSCPGGTRDPTSDGKGAKSGSSSNSDGFTVSVRRMQRRNWIILAGAAVLVTLVIVVAIVLVTMQNDEDPGVKMYNTDSESSKHVKLSPLERPAFCLEEPDPGMCRAYFEMYHYDPKTDSCKMFVYGGCDGNANKFKTMADCERDCLAGNKSSVSNAIDDETDQDVPDNKDPDVVNAKIAGKASDETGNSLSKVNE